jgi:hypothetical protein
MILAAVASMVVVTIAAVSHQRRSHNDRDFADQEMEQVRRLSISAVALGIVATFLIFCLSPGIIQQTLTCVVYVLPVLSIAALATSLVMLWRRHRHPQIAVPDKSLGGTGSGESC